MKRKRIAALGLGLNCNCLFRADASNGGHPHMRSKFRRLTISSQIISLAGCAIFCLKAIRKSVARSPSYTRWSAESVTTMRCSVAGSPFRKTMVASEPPTAMMQACGGLMMAKN